ncbi:hypothetical protein TVAG_281920 [Trichomonas vaginalis G3]|uniref:Uncharacterized protein n=1 Tax=Trichomonas vaginalis (strain ATCC PRA-98 / G3) TaxID=412133 RepID=A2E9Q7_TRIV3|nr:positive regulation of myosin-light-chain-phosphatase protein [Trichomonas vaginalis G3]EAY10592.1 hypothetical protein TVAG_281920 [Trichomonas vaginalis G3]KAI5540844.1 positive regulation of myosin-light-chain-phosphatase protein [Trichomonas vaginalis G3]|eukprot:XP_001322815.1 hypothetical protein [Trichomonas vaginalis G3]
MTEFLISNGADINAKGNDGNAALHHTLYNNIKEMAEFLISNGANVNAKNENAWTPLHYAARCDKKEMTEFLISLLVVVLWLKINNVYYHFYYLFNNIYIYI